MAEDVDPTEFVGHCKRDKTDVYAGRGSGGRSFHDTPIGERGWLGNPYTLEDASSREDSIRQFRRDFEHRLLSDGEFRAAIADLAGRTLGCWCQNVEDDGPACHAEVIAEHANRIARGADFGELRVIRRQLSLQAAPSLVSKKDSSPNMDNLTAFQRDLLYVIANFDKPSGQTVSDELQTYYDSEINYGRLYPNLDTLVDHGLVEKGQIDRRTNYYALTEAGEQAFRDRREWENQYVDL